MLVGLIGCGKMGTALARGWGQPVLCSDVVAELAERLAAETGGEAVDNTELASRADVVMLCHKPYQLQQVASEIEGRPKAVASILAGVTIEQLQAAYPGTPVIRLMPNTPVEVGRGVICYAVDAPAPLVDELLALLGKTSRLFPLEERLMEVATALMSVAPAYVALVAEAWIDAGIAHGIPARQASELVAEAIAGSAELLIAQDVDTLAVRRGVTTPGGVTAQGLAALEAGGIRAAFRDAVDAVLAHNP